MKRIFVILLLTVFGNLFAQQTTLQLGNQQVINIANRWYLTDNSGMKFQVDTVSITVKLLETENDYIFRQIISTLGVSIEKENKLGFIDLVLPTNSKFYKIFSHLQQTGLCETIEVNSFGEIFSNDPGFPNQYYLLNSYGYPKINASYNNVWWFEDGSTNPVTVAIIDEGVDQTHQDIRLETTTDWDYVDEDATPHPDNNNGQYDEDHGTGIAGIIAAKANNYLDVAGVAGGYNSNATKIMSLRVGEGEYSGWPAPVWHTIIKTSKVDDAIIHAADNGAKVINMSFGVAQNSSIEAAINYAYNKKCCVLIAASGNNTANGLFGYPASNDLVMAISGINKDWTRYGSWNGDIDVVAPSQDIYTLKNSFSGSTWGYWGTGTSASSPQVAGVAALLLSRNPNLLHIDLRNIINQTANSVGSSTFFGNGLLKADNSLSWLETPWVNSPQNVSITKIVGTHPVIHWSAVTGVEKYYIYRSNSDWGRYGFVKVATVSSGTSWTDNSVVVQHPRFALSTNYYRVASVDSNDDISILSNEVFCGVNATSKEVGGEEVDELVYDYHLYNNFPNPFNPSTTIKFSLKENRFVKLEVFNLLGEKVAQLINRKIETGIHEVSLNAEKLPSGLYIYRLDVAGKYVKSRKMLLLK
ncbi:MAG: S8 family serine peptidase [Melioribacteraceae bacterium]|nr:S8 family serine peptidase [Melioribacteraceae bacterium]